MASSHEVEEKKMLAATPTRPCTRLRYNNQMRFDNSSHLQATSLTHSHIIHLSNATLKDSVWHQNVVPADSQCRSKQHLRPDVWSDS